MIETLVSILILTGAVFTFVGALGLLRLPDFYCRLHAPTKATTLGVGSLLLASALWFSARGAGPSLHEVLVTLFLFITAPVSAHLLAKAALHLHLQSLASLPAAAAPSGQRPGNPPPIAADDAIMPQTSWETPFPPR